MVHLNVVTRKYKGKTSIKKGKIILDNYNDVDELIKLGILPSNFLFILSQAFFDAEQMKMEKMLNEIFCANENKKDNMCRKLYIHIPRKSKKTAYINYINRAYINRHLNVFASDKRRMIVKHMYR